MTRRLTTACRVMALRAGQWQQGDGTFVAVRRMHRGHLVNALMQALATGDAKPIVDGLVAEVARRGLTEHALAVAQERERQLSRMAGRAR